MTKNEHLLKILSEECSETAIRVSKAMRFSLQEVQPGQHLNNAERIIYEFNDIVAMMDMLKEEGIIGDYIDLKSQAAKKEKVMKFLELSKQNGTLTD